MLFLISKRSKRKFKKALRKILPMALVGLVAISAVALHSKIFLSTFGQEIELSQTDLWFRLRGVKPPPQEIVVVAMDELTYSELGISTLDPLPRAMIAEMLEALAESGIKLAILDMFFRDIGTNPEVDQRLARAIRLSPTFIGSFQINDPSSKKNEIKLLEVLPRPEFASRAERVAMMNLVGDDKIRIFTPAKPAQDRNPPLPVAYAAREPKKTLPSPFDLINYYGPPGSILRVSAYEILRNDPSKNRAIFSGKTILVGSALAAMTGFTIKDSFANPTSSSQMGGVEIHATIVGNILKGEWIRRFSPVWELPALNVLAVLFCALIFRLSPLSGLGLTLAVLVTWSLGAYWAFLHETFIPGVNLVWVIFPCVFSLAVLLKHRVLNSRYLQVQEMLGGSGISPDKT
jgi:adenylate cyclase